MTEAFPSAISSLDFFLLWCLLQFSECGLFILDASFDPHLAIHHQERDGGTTDADAGLPCGGYSIVPIRDLVVNGTHSPLGAFDR